MKGKLYLVPTPIGNLQDMTFRALEVLKMVDLVACEDTRETMKLFHHFDIKKKLISYFEHNKVEKGQRIVDQILAGQQVALVSDAGTPAISDPGEDLVKLAIAHDIEVVPIPGAVALTTALIASGLPTARFLFEGFLPTNKRAKNERIEALRGEIRTIIFYEAPHKLIRTLEALYAILGDRKIVLARELTKKFEEFKRSTLIQAIADYHDKAPRGEFVLLLEGAPAASAAAVESVIPSSENVKATVDLLIANGFEKKEAMKQAAKQMNCTKREIYRHYVQET